MIVIDRKSAEFVLLCRLLQDAVPQSVEKVYVDIDIGVVVKTGLEGAERDKLRLLMIYLADDFAERNLMLAWNTEYDWTCDPRTPGVAEQRFTVGVCGAGRQDAVLKALIEKELAVFVRSGMKPHVDSFDIEEIVSEIDSDSI